MNEKQCKSNLYAQAYTTYLVMCFPWALQQRQVNKQETLATKATSYMESRDSDGRAAYANEAAQGPCWFLLAISDVGIRRGISPVYAGGVKKKMENFIWTLEEALGVSAGVSPKR